MNQLKWISIRRLVAGSCALRIETFTITSVICVFLSSSMAQPTAQGTKPEQMIHQVTQRETPPNSEVPKATLGKEATSDEDVIIFEMLILESAKKWEPTPLPVLLSKRFAEINMRAKAMPQPVRSSLTGPVNEDVAANRSAGPKSIAVESDTRSSHEAISLADRERRLSTALLNDFTDIELSDRLTNAEIEKLFDPDFRRKNELTALSGPKIISQMDTTSSVTVGQMTTSTLYMERIGDRQFELKALPPQQLGLTINLTPKQTGSSTNQISLDPIEVAFTVMNGREQIDGIDLQIGKPNISTHTFKTSFALKKGVMHCVDISTVPGKFAIMVIRYNILKQSDLNADSK